MTNPVTKKSGMCIPCSVRQAGDKGLGVFAEAAVSKGTTVWRHVPGNFRVLDENALTGLLKQGTREEAVDLLIHIVSMEEFPGYMVQFFDEGALLNHSEQPNVTRKQGNDEYLVPTVTSVAEVTDALMDSRFDLVTLCDLAAGDELLMDYNAEPDDPAYFEEACIEYGVDWDWL